MSKRLENYLQIIDSEMTILNRMIAYRENTASCTEEQRNLDNVRAYKVHVNELQKLFSNTIKKFQEIETHNKNN